MNILLVCRGSQGDIYPYLAVAAELVNRGHAVLLSLPRVFEKDAKSFGLTYTLQAADDIVGMVGSANNTKDLLAWTKRVIHDQFEELIPLVRRHDVLVASNTEFSAPTIAEYCRKPFVRTAYAPLLPSRALPPPVMPWPKPNRLITPGLQWKMLNMVLNLMVRKVLNTHRKALGMAPIADQGEHAPRHGNNFLMYSRFLGEVDPQWPYIWNIGGYCFNDRIPYNEEAYRKLADFMRKDRRPSLFFTLGSCVSKKGDRFCSWLLDLCEERDYKLVVGAGWWKLGERLHDKERLFLLNTVIPHHLIFPFCDAVIHHGGSGTAHSAARAGKPQMAVPLILDQHYWGYRAASLGLGPGYINIGRISREETALKVSDLLTNPLYRQNAGNLAAQIQSEQGIQNLCAYLASSCAEPPPVQPEAVSVTQSTAGRV
ncbi:MAG: glycosyltransferase [Spirochaetaceae bacterium]|jgi:UDP:flavonoid glycosyltransferase YjiC (YdhE family)|nr:glycosyltransferase [Spirochaetaceae bacterium]